ncbi:MAG: hypothetical protein ACK4SX_11805 [Alcanivoracaceae bacterium]
MASTVLIIGLTLFLMGTVMLAMDAQQRGRSSLIFALPFAGAGYIHHYWSDVWLPALIRVVGISLIIVAGAVAVARDPMVLEQPRRLFGVPATVEIVGSKRVEMNTFANSQAAVLLAIRSDSNPLLTGRLRGRDFVYDEARLVRGVLSVQQGEGFVPEVEVRLLLDLNADDITRERRTLFVRPADDTAPELQISWRDDVGQLRTEIIRRGYQMELQIARRDRSNLVGFLQIILPDPDRSYLSGEFIARTNFLRYSQDRVDLTFDHPDTLEYVGRQYLETQFPENTVRSMQFRDTRLLFSESGGVSAAEVELVNGRVEERVLRFDRTDIGWSVKPGGMQTRVLREAEAPGLRLVVPSGQTSRQPPAVVVPPPVTMTFDQLDTLSGQQAVIHQRDGRNREGILRGLRRSRLIIESIVGGGTVEFSFAEAELSHLVLQSGQRVLLAGYTPSATIVEEVAVEAVAPTPAPAADVADAAPPPVEAVGSDVEAYAALRGREVTITSRDTRVRTGVLTDVTPRQLTLSVRAGAGTLEYFYAPSDVVSLVEVRR